MATFREVTYMVLDLLKEHSDDSFYTEDHIVFLLKNMRAYILEKSYKESRNTAFKELADGNSQTICLDLIPADALPGSCAGGWLRSKKKVPSLLGVSPIKVYPFNELVNTVVTYIPAERMPFVGHNKWLKNIIYCAKADDDYIYLHSVNPQFLFLEKARLTGVFADPEEAGKLECNADGSKKICDVLDMEFPLEGDLIPLCIESVLQEIMGSRYVPEDKTNNAKDDLGDIASTSQRNPSGTKRANAG